MKKVVMIAGGGTGGHIYPGLAIAKALIKMDPEIEVHFVGTRNGLESRIVPREGFILHTIVGGKLNFSGQWFTKLKTLIKLPWGLVQSVSLLLHYRPMAVLGVGGYASGPFALVAALLGFPTSIWEANVHPGMANRLLSRFVDKCFLVFTESKKYLNCREYVMSGVPVRQDIEVSAVQADLAEGDKSKEFTLLHYGGSQGSRFIGQTLCQAVLSDHPWTDNLKVIHQTGSVDFEDFKKKYQKLKNPNSVEVCDFIFDMKSYYQKADLVLCRGGASTLNELAAFGLPAIIIPLPAADAHQEHNARVLVEAGAAKMILQKDLTADRLIEEIQDLRNSSAQRAQLKKNIRQFYKPQAAEQIAKSLLQT